MTTVSERPAARPVAQPDTGGSWSRGSWSSGACAALEHRFELILPRENDFVEVLGAMVRPFTTQACSSDSTVGRYVLASSTDGLLPYALYHNGERITGGMHARDFCTMLSWHINHSVIRTSGVRHVLMHAAAVTVAGMTVILPADQESGKSTTTAGLLRQGYGYVTDEAVALHPVTGAITPFPKTLSLDPGSWHLFPELSRAHGHPRARQWHVPAVHLGSYAEARPVAAPRLIVFPRYCAGSATTLEPTSKAEAVRLLALMTFDFRRHTGRNLRLLGQIAAGATVARLTIGSLDEAIDAVDELVSNAILEEM